MKISNAYSESRGAFFYNSNFRFSGNQEVMNVLTFEGKALSRRQLSALTGLEIATLCKILHDLVYRYQKVRVSYHARCRTTGRMVIYYSICN